MRSSQASTTPGWHARLPHWSFSVQALPSVHATALGTVVQPVAGLQLSSVQSTPSSQAIMPDPTHVPPEQESVVVQTFPSSQLPMRLACAHALLGASQ